MTRRQAATAAPRPLEVYAPHFDDLSSTVNPQEASRLYLAGLLLPNGRNKTLTALAKAEPLVGPPDSVVQARQWFLSYATWGVEAVTQRRIELMRAERATAPVLRACFCSTSRVTANGAQRSRTLGASIWAASARWTTPSSQSPRCGRMSAPTTRGPSSRSLQSGTAPRASAT